MAQPRGLRRQRHDGAGIVSAGISRGDGLNFSIRSSFLAKLADKIGRQGTFRAAPRFSFSLQPLVYHFDNALGTRLTGLLVGGIGAELMLRERYIVHLSGGHLSASESLPSDDGPLDRRFSRLNFEARLDFRHLFTWNQQRGAQSVRVGVGGILTRDKVTERSLSLQLEDPNCDFAGESCDVTTVASESKSVDWKLRPKITVSSNIGPVSLTYGFAMDPLDVSDRTQDIVLRYRFLTPP